MVKTAIELYKKNIPKEDMKLQKIAESLPRAALSRNQNAYFNGEYFQDQQSSIIAVNWYSKMIKNAKGYGLFPWTIIAASLTGSFGAVSLASLLFGNPELALGFGITTGATAFITSPLYTTMAIFKSRVHRAQAVEMANIKKMLSNKYQGVEIVNEAYMRKKDLHDFLLGKVMRFEVIGYLDTDEPRSGSLRVMIDQRLNTYSVGGAFAKPKEVVTREKEAEVLNLRDWIKRLPESVTDDTEFSALLFAIISKAQVAYSLDLGVEFQHSVNRVVEVSMKTSELYGSFLGLARKPEVVAQARKTAFDTLYAVDEELETMLDSEESNVLDQLETQKRFLDEVRNS